MKQPLCYDWDVFVSHNSQQKIWVREAVNQFRELGIKVFFDEENIQPGDDIVEGIERGLNGSRHILFVITPSACASRWTAMETASTIISDPDASEKRMIPILLESTEPEKIRLSVKRLQMVDLTNQVERRQNYHRLLRFLEVDSPTLPDPPEWPDTPKSQELPLTMPNGHQSDSEEVAVATGLSAIEITINREFETYSDNDQQKLLRAIKDILDVSDDIRIINKRKGSVILKLELSADQAERLMLAVKAGQFDEFDVVEASILEQFYTDESRPAQAAEQSLDTAIPGIIGRYTVQSLLGSGGFGRVYRAYDGALNRDVVLKVFHHSNLQFESFMREARAISTLSHPGLIPLYEAGETEGHCYVVTPYLKGQTLNEWMAKSQPNWSTAARIVADLANTLNYVHNQSIVHRSLDPNQILLVDSGPIGRPHAVICDFGLENLTEQPESPSAISGTTVFAGTPGFVAPEGLRGAKNVDARSDIYSLGVIFMVMLSRKGSSIDPRGQSNLGPEIPEELLRIGQRATELQPEKRFQDAKAMAAALLTALSDLE